MHEKRVFHICSIYLQHYKPKVYTHRIIKTNIYFLLQLISKKHKIFFENYVMKISFHFLLMGFIIHNRDEICFKRIFLMFQHCFLFKGIRETQVDMCVFFVKTSVFFACLEAFCVNILCENTKL